VTERRGDGGDGRARRGLALAVAIAVAALVAGCGGIPSDDAPTLVARDAVPAELSESSTTTVATGAAFPGRLYLLFAPAEGEERLLTCPVLVDRAETASGQAVAVLQALIALVPTESGCLASLINAVPPDLQILGAEVDDRVLVLDLANLTAVQGVAARRAIAQIVFTATAVPGIDGVRFRQEGEDIAVNVSDGRTLSEGEAVYPSDFPKFQELENTEATSTTTTAPPPIAPPPVDPLAPPAPTTTP
jgi:hypothetical protein